MFEEGDPDRPIVTGRVYNAENMPPIALPGGKSQSIIRDHGGNEIIMEGAAGAQKMRLYSPTHETTLTLGNSVEVKTLSDWKELVAGQKNEEIIGPYSCKVGADVKELFLGAKHDTVVGSRTELTFINKNESTVGLLSEMCGGIKVDIHKGKHFVHQPDEIEITAARRISKASHELKSLTSWQQTNCPWVRTNTSNFECNSKDGQIHLVNGKLTLRVGGSMIEMTSSQIKLTTSEIVLNAENVKVEGDFYAYKSGYFKGSLESKVGVYLDSKALKAE
jgi:hypothetical protein